MHRAASRSQKVCPQRRPVPSSRETLTCDPGELPRGAGEGLTGGGSPGGAGKSGAGPRGRGAAQPRVGDPGGRAWTAAGRGPCSPGPDAHFRVRGPGRSGPNGRGLGGPGGLGAGAGHPGAGAGAVRGSASGLEGDGAGGGRGGAPRRQCVPAAWTRRLQRGRLRLRLAGCTVPCARTELAAAW